MKKFLIGLVGGPCTGKTTLASALKRELAEKGITAAWSKEFVSQDLPLNGPPRAELSHYEQFRYSFYQTRNEEAALREADVVVTDAPIFMGYLYSIMNDAVAKECGRQAIFLKEFERLIAEDVHRYTHLFFLKREFPYRENGVRFHSLDEARAFDREIRRILETHKVPFTEISGGVEARKQYVLAATGLSNVISLNNKKPEGYDALRSIA